LAFVHCFSPAGLCGDEAAEEGGELLDAELLGAGVGAEVEGGEGFADQFRAGEGAQVVDQGFSLLSETQFYEIEEALLVFQAECGAGAGQAQGDERGGDFGRGLEGAAGNLQGDFGVGEVLGEDGEVAVVAGAGAGGEALGDFELDDDVDGFDLRGVLEEPVQDGRGDVVGEIAVDAHAPVGEEFCEIELEDVAGDDGEVGESFGEALEAGDERGIELDASDGKTGGEKVFGHFAVAGADFEPGSLRGRGGSEASGVAGDADGARDLFAPGGVGEKVLSKALTGHAGDSVAGGAGTWFAYGGW
jgi:hypothetical protein